MYVFCCSNWFQNQTQGNHRNMGSTKKKLSRKTFPNIPFLRVTTSSRRSLGKVIHGPRPVSGMEAMGTKCHSPTQVDQMW